MTEKTNHQIHRFLNKIAEKYPETETPELFTDIHIRVSQDTGDLMAFDDDDKEVTRVVVDEWINSPQNTEYFYNRIASDMQEYIETTCSKLGIIKPYNFVLENENGEHITELFVVDDSETMILGKPFIKDLDKELDDFISNLLKD